MSVSGHIVTTSTQGVYFLPSTSALPPLWWNARRQRFVAIVHARDNAMTAAAAAAAAAHARTSGDVADGSVSNDGDGNAASQATARAAAGVKAAAADAHASRALMPAACTASVRCAALYGVLPVGADVSVLLYVTERTHVAALQLGDERTHDVYVVTRLEYMRLPSPYDEVPGNGGESALANDDDNDDCDDDDTNNDNRTYCCTLCNDSHSDDDDDCDDDDDHHSHSKRSRHRRVCLAEGTVREYLRVVHRFCASVSSSSSCVYYSPTVNLALCTHDLVSGATTSSSHTTSRVAHDDDDGSDASRAVWQWNAMLLSRFALPCVHAASAAAGATAAASLTRDMYVPSYMRGFVGQRTLRGACRHDDQHSSDGAAAVVSHTHTSSSSSNNNSCSSRCSSCVLSMVTRLSCRWAGTRYHRRGLEPDGSGVTANLAMTTMWLHCNTRAQGDSNNSNKSGNNNDNNGSRGSECNEKDATRQTCVRRVAVCEMVRGSVPLRWQQPADLSLKPPIHILTAVNGRHDRPGRHKGSNSGSDGTAAAVAHERRASEVGSASAAAAANDLCTHIRLLQALLSPLRVRVLCLLDTTSRRSRLERPLSEHYDDVVAYASSQQQEQEVHMQTAEQQQQQQRRLPTLVYVHHDLGSDVHHRHCASTRRRVCAAVRDALRPCMTTSPPPSPIASSLFTAYEQHHGGGGSGSVDDVHTDSSHMTTTAAATAAAAAVVVVHAVQTVCVRVNCLDCLDRTNLAQCLLMQPLLQHMLAYVCTGTLEPHQHTTDVLQPLRQRPQPSSPSSSSSLLCNEDDVVHALRHGVHCAAQELFAQQGRALSYLYAHSPPHLLAYMCDDDDNDDDDCCDGAAGHSHNSRNNNNDDDGAADVAAVTATRGALQPLRTSRARRTWRVRWQLYAGGAVIALRRWYQQNFRDGAKQDAVSLLTRQHEPVLFCSNAAAAVAVATSAATRATTTTTAAATVTAAVATPFARDLTSMNRLMHYGVLLPLVPLLVSVVLALCAHDTATARLHLVLAMAWAVYVCVVAYRLRRYRVTYTNRSLLSYGHR